MTDYAWRIRACRAPLEVLAVCVLMSGCAAYQAEQTPMMTHVVAGDGTTHRCYMACSSGFHPTVWQTWQEGSMAMRSGGVEMGTPPVQPGPNDRAAPGLPPPGPPIPESIPTPKPEPPKGEMPNPPGVLAPLTSDALPKTAIESGSRKSRNQTRNRLRPASSLLRFSKRPLSLLARNRRFPRRPPAVPRSRSLLDLKGKAPVSASLATSRPKRAQICQGFPKPSPRRFSAAAR